MHHSTHNDFKIVYAICVPSVAQKLSLQNLKRLVFGGLVIIRSRFLHEMKDVFIEKYLPSFVNLIQGILKRKYHCTVDLLFGLESAV